MPAPEAAADAPRQLTPLTSKPSSTSPTSTRASREVAGAGRRARRRGRTPAAVAVSARIEAELAELDAGRGGGDARRARASRESGLERLVHAAYELLDLITFFTADSDKEAMARSLRRGGTAWEAAGRSTRDIQQAFVRAEVIGWERAGRLPAATSPARDRGLLRIEGRDYVVADGDVVHIRT